MRQGTNSGLQVEARALLKGGPYDGQTYEGPVHPGDALFVFASGAAYELTTERARGSNGVEYEIWKHRPQ